LADGSADGADDSEIFEMDLLTTLAIVLLVLWLLGLVSSYTLGGFIHILLVIALVVILIRVLQGRRPIP
jgi:hypothetical protein